MVWPRRAKIPDDVKRTLHGAAANLVKKPDFARMSEHASFTVLPGDETAFRELIDAELALWLPIIKDADIRPQ